MVKVIRMSEIGHNRRGANPTRLSGLFSEGYARKRASFWQIVRVRSLPIPDWGFVTCEQSRKRVNGGRANPSEPDMVRIIRMSEISHNRRGANPTRLSGLFSEGCPQKTASFWQIVCLRVRSDCRLRAALANRAFDRGRSALPPKPDAARLLRRRRRSFLPFSGNKPRRRLPAAAPWLPRPAAGRRAAVPVRSAPSGTLRSRPPWG